MLADLDLWSLRGLLGILRFIHVWISDLTSLCISFHVVDASGWGMIITHLHSLRT